MYLHITQVNIYIYVYIFRHRETKKRATLQALTLAIMCYPSISQDCPPDDDWSSQQIHHIYRIWTLWCIIAEHSFMLYPVLPTFMTGWIVCYRRFVQPSPVEYRPARKRGSWTWGTSNAPDALAGLGLVFVLWISSLRCTTPRAQDAEQLFFSVGSEAT